ncbi:MAG TPA: invasin domain 3-containing protein, partial [Myxococcales bacterium]|nr:invasin domain 3-containing protein [Myxococcales bacterium]
MNKLHAGVLVAIFAFVAACDGCGPPPPPPTPDPSRSTVEVDRPTGAIADGADQVQVRVTIRDSASNPVEGVAVTIAATGTGNTLVQPAGPTNANGVATGTLSTTVAESKTISATISQGPIPSTATAVFGPGPVSASASTVVASPTTVIADGVASATITVTLRDASGNAIPGKAVTLSATGAQNTFTQPSATDVRGVAVGVLRSTRAEAKVVTATVDGTELLQQPSLQFVAGAASKLAFTVPPSTSTAGVAISPPVQVEIQDAGGNRVPGSTLPVTITLAGGTPGAILGGTRTVAAVDGVAVFSTLAVDRAGAGYTLVAAASGLGTTTSAAFDVTAGASNKLAFIVQPADTAAGATITPSIQVALQDAAGNLITTGTAVVTLALMGTGTLSGSTSVAASGGIATFSNLSIDRAQSGATLVATASMFTGATSQAFNILPGAANRLAFSTQPSNVASGAAIAPAVQVTVQDALGNTVTGDTRTVALGMGNNPGGATLSGTTSVSAVAGVATFNNVSLDKAGSGYTLIASAAGVSSAVSAGFNVTAGPASKLAFITQPPASVASNATFAAAVQVAIQDAAGNTIPTAGNAVTLSLSGGTAGAVLSGTLTQAAVGGIATFAGLSVDLAGAGYALNATGAALTSATSTSFTVVPGPASRLVFTTQPPNGVAGQQLSPPPSVSVVDAAGNVVTSATNAITVSLSGGTAGAVLSGTLTRNASSGVATFDGLSVDRSGTGYVLGATAASLTAASSATFSISPGAPSRLAFTVQPVNSTAGQLFTVEVTVRDALGNTSPTPNQTVVLSLASGPTATLGGTTTLTTTAGVASFTDLHIDTIGSGYSIGATAAGLTSATSNAFNIAAGAPSQLVFLAPPSDGTNLGVITVGIRDQFGNPTNSTASVTVSLTFNPSGGTLQGTRTVAAVVGIATFTNLAIDLPGQYRMGASSPGLMGTESNLFTLTPAAITGTRIAHHVLDDGGIVNVPQDISAAVIGAYSPNDAGSYTFIPGTGTAAGTFQIPNVPVGSYYLRFNNDYVDTSARVVDLGFHVQGRPNVAQADAGTFQQHALTGMSPWFFDSFWFEEDDLQMYSSGANVWFSPLEGFETAGQAITPGATTFDQLTDYDLIAQNGVVPRLVNASRGDRTYITQLTTRDAGFLVDDAGTTLAWNAYRGLERSFGPAALTVADGQTTTVSGSFSPVPQQTLPMNWLIEESTPGSFGSFRTAIHPNTRTDSIQHGLFVSVLPFGNSYGFYGSAPDLLSMNLFDGTFSPQEDQSIAFQHGDPFPPSWSRFAEEFTFFFVTYQ